MKVIIALSCLWVVKASCPNDCSGNGNCNTYSACDCYRNFMGADCSERVCGFGHSFIDTPTGDLNADGRISTSRATYRVVLGSTSSFFTKLGDTTPITETMKGAELDIVDPIAGTVTKSPIERTTFSVCDESGDCSSTGTKYEMLSDIIVEYSQDPLNPPSPQKPYQANDIYGYVEACKTSTQRSFGMKLDYAIAFDIYAADGTVPSNDALIYEIKVQPGGDSDSATPPTTYFGGDQLNGLAAHRTATIVCSITPSTYKVQWSNTDEWEAYPTNHAHAIAQSSAGNISDFDEAHFYMECSNKGTCNRATGECQCFPGYTGEACSRTACPNDCSGHGLCRRLIDIVGIDYNAWDAYKTQRCVCDAGYKGTDCSLQKCPMGDDPITRLNNRNEVQAVAFKNKDDAYVMADFHGDSDENGNKLLPMGDTFLFSLEFTDEMGDSWITESINLFDFSNLEVNVKQALESLPNKVVQDIEVNDFGQCINDSSTSVVSMSKNDCINDSAHTWTSGRCIGEDGELELAKKTACTGNSEWSDTGFNVTFLKNSGAIPLMRARYRFGNMHEGTLMTNAPGGDFQQPCSVDDRGNKIYTKYMCETLVENGSWSVTASGGVGMFSIYRPILPGTNDDQVKTYTHGNKENVECSNRGLCDNGTGQCKCFAGFTEHDCSVQNALSSGS